MGQTYDIEPPEPPAPKSSLLDAPDEVPCPSCSTRLPAGVVVCLSCGYDMIKGVKRAVQTGEQEVVEETVKLPVVPSKGPKNTLLLVIALVTLVTAMVIGAMNMTEASGVLMRLWRAMYIALSTATNLGVCLVAVWFLAWLESRPFGKVADAAARILVACAIFACIWTLVFPLGGLGMALKFLCACGMFWGLIWLFFGRNVQLTNKICALSIVMGALLSLQNWLWSATSSGIMW